MIIGRYAGMLSLKGNAMLNLIKKSSITLFLAIVAGGCAAPLPVPFQLVDSLSRVQLGTLYPDAQRIEVIVDGHLFSGFYIVESGSAISQTVSGRRHLPYSTITNYFTNSARAHLTSDNGQQLNCEFLYEARRAIGECRTPSGIVFQLDADDRFSKDK